MFLNFSKILSYLQLFKYMNLLSSVKISPKIPNFSDSQVLKILTASVISKKSQLNPAQSNLPKILPLQLPFEFFPYRELPRDKKVSLTMVK